ncbi:unnamed protein product, partial [marine sediment metagenome]
LDIATVKGWNCVVGKDSIKVGDLVVYITPDDAVLPHKLMEILFNNTKISAPSNGRIRTIKIRGAISQGLIITENQLKDFYPEIKKRFVVGSIMDEYLEITKYEPKEKSPYSTRGGNQTFKKQINPNFRKYTDINHLKNYPDIFRPDEYIVITEKIHGTNFRAGYVPIHHYTGWKKWLKKIRSWIDKKNFKYPGYEFVFGSHNIQLQEKNKNNRKKRKSMKKYFKKNVYECIVEQYKLRDILAPDEVIYGEIYGANIQKKYQYGLTDSIALAIFDIIHYKKWIDFENAFWRCIDLELQYVPILFKGYRNEIDFDEIVRGPSILCATQKIREGIVVQPYREKAGYMGRMIFKYLNPDYLIKKGNSDWH